MFVSDGEYLFAEPDSKLSKYAPKSWRSSHSHGLDANGRPALAFYFRVQFYVDSPLLLRDETTRHHYYLQLRLNATSGAAGDHATHLAGFSLQADLGDHNENTTFRPEDYVPPNMRGPAALRIIEAAHRTHRGLSKNDARTRFIAEACQLQEPVNAHMFRLRAAKSEPAPGSLLLAVCPRGLKVCPENNPPSIFLWSSIGKLSFERKKFEIRTGHEKLTLYTSSDEKSRLLLSLCKAAHQFSMAVAPRLNEVRREEEERQRWDCDQRISVISSTSSNTTSGIVSDRVHSEDELEIMITSPPAPSTESLALAHLLDSAPASSRTSAASATAALATLTLKEEEEEVNKPTLSESSTKTASGKCAGSQCSSSCSTVVVTTAQSKPKGRRSSTTSSLELGYSHTAQNSALSDATCIELDTKEPVYTSGPAPSSHTSGVYTLTSSEQYTLSSSDHYTIPSEQYSTPSEQYSTPGDHVDGPFRDRANSNVSNSGSFHGDGSDPTDNKQALLSAEELSDLIVGRYPSCKSVSHTLDSDSDYVTLPSSYKGYIPIPPKRVDSVEQRFRPPPPPYGAQLSKMTIPETTCPDYDDTSCLSETSMRHPPPYPENPTPIPPPVYPFEEAAARFITTRSPSILTAHASAVSVSSSPSYSTPSSVPPIPPKIPRPPPPVSSTVISPNNYLDVAASKASVLVPCTFLPPPPPAPRQPPPPPPALATVYTSQLSRSQIEQYQQQMYSDVDFVVFPLKEPAISKQEYLEAKQGSLMAALAHQPVFYRSTPYLGRYASSQNLSDTYVQLPVYGAPSISSSGSLDPPPPPLPPNRPGRFMRTRSDDNILNSLDMPQPPKFRRLPPPPPPPIPEKHTSLLENHMSVLDSKVKSVSEKPLNGNANERASALDIRTLREKSKKMDLPLISALCNDRSLIKQTKAFVMPKHPGEVIPRQSLSSTRAKYPVSGLSSTRINKPTRKTTSVSHRHPGDKLPEIPRALPNNYVLTDPRTKHKTMQSHS
ncbi:hypothetical protein NQ314_002789 [Rhamnusium bicolor]|uniref:FERM domain-containing protein n=1 Tax=Rhamnusium bicolor TaxID=1586634 RepID=A0AAV8ZQ35_9CUCU|nr:hypothetical protein NQ314_002789 [Rhamnusium bicolor]